MTVIEADLPRERNPQFYRLLDEANELREEGNRIRSRFNHLRPSRIRWISTYSRLTRLEEWLGDWRNDFSLWEHEVLQFVNGPSMTVRTSGRMTDEAAMAHYLSWLRDARLTTREQLEGLNFLASQKRNELAVSESRFVAGVAVAISIASLLLALC